MYAVTTFINFYIGHFAENNRGGLHYRVIVDYSEDFSVEMVG